MTGWVKILSMSNELTPSQILMLILSVVVTLLPVVFGGKNSAHNNSSYGDRQCPKCYPMSQIKVEQCVANSHWPRSYDVIEWFPADSIFKGSGNELIGTPFFYYINQNFH